MHGQVNKEWQIPAAHYVSGSAGQVRQTQNLDQAEWGAVVPVRQPHY